MPFIVKYCGCEVLIFDDIFTGEPKTSKIICRWHRFLKFIRGLK